MAPDRLLAFWASGLGEDLDFHCEMNALAGVSRLGIGGGGETVRVRGDLQRGAAWCGASPSVMGKVLKDRAVGCPF